MKFTQNYYAHSSIFAKSSKEDLRAFYRAFIENVPYSLDELFGLIWKTEGFSKWPASFHENSLPALGEWMKSALQILSPEGMLLPSPKSPEWQGLKTSAWDFSDRSREMIVAVGMYYGEIMVRNNPGVTWVHLLENKKSADFGQPVIGGEVRRIINPVRVATSFSFGIVDGSESSDGLLLAYRFWRDNLLKS